MENTWLQEEMYMTTGGNIKKNQCEDDLEPQ
jgi:hypothetical protein